MEKIVSSSRGNAAFPGGLGVEEGTRFPGRNAAFPGGLGMEEGPRFPGRNAAFPGGRAASSRVYREYLEWISSERGLEAHLPAKMPALRLVFTLASSCFHPCQLLVSSCQLLFSPCQLLPAKITTHTEE